MDRKFVQRVLIEDLNELKINALAMVKSRNVRVREIARAFFECYSSNHVKIAKLAENGHMKVSVKPEPEECSSLENLRIVSPKSFDRVYLHMIARRQRETISLARAELQEGRDPEVREMASVLLHQLEHHLEAAIGVLKLQPC